ncbi:MAG TPA: hypothetical protein VF988_09830 [Verrucomicrobiae bacterium]
MLAGRTVIVEFPLVVVLVVVLVLVLECFSGTFCGEAPQPRQTFCGGGAAATSAAVTMADENTAD